MTTKITKVLIANRGEIALRIQRAAQALGIKSVCVASEADKNSLFARHAEELVLIGPPPAAQSYLNQEKLIETALATRCDALHPGYGFLSENAEFARKVREAGIVFIGPSFEAIQTLGSKTGARERVTQFGVPCTPGAIGGLADEALIQRAEEIGFPVIIKAVAGGGGRGMRVIQDRIEMATLLPRARSEALKNFGSSDVYCEKYIVNPRHVEVQVFGDHHGTVVHFGTRDCSSQRRHQKLIEEAPAPFLSDNLREAIHTAAVKAAQSVGYTGAGTAEFLVSGETFYFLEMNTRIQVEHPVSETITGQDLVKLQFEVEQGGKVPPQAEIEFRGHAIEFRIYAEDPTAQFRPDIGKIREIKRPSAPYIREDYGFESGDEVTPYYDAMLSKLIVSGATRDEALERSEKALREYSVTGLKTTLLFHRWLITQPRFRTECVDIGFVEREFTNPEESLRAIRAGDIKDPAHVPPLAGVERLEHFRFHDPERDLNYTIELLHHRDGYFVARPMLNGVVAQNEYCRRSNGRETALRAVIEILRGEIDFP